MKPEELSEKLFDIRHHIEVRRSSILEARMPAIDEHRAKIREALEEVEEINRIELAEAIRPVMSAENEQKHLLRSRGKIGAAYGEALITYCSSGERNGGSVSTFDILLTNPQARLNHAGMEVVKARLTAYGYGKGSPLDGHKIKGYEIVVALCQNGDKDLDDLELSTFNVDPSELPKFAKLNEPKGSVVVIDAEYMGFDEQGDFVMSDDFTFLAKFLLEQASDPSNVPDAYESDSIASSETIELQPFFTS